MGRACMVDILWFVFLLAIKQEVPSDVSLEWSLHFNNYALPQSFQDKSLSDFHHMKK